MRSAYKYLAYAIPICVVIQAMAIAVALFGLGAYNSDHALPKSMADSNVSFTGDFGFAVHGIMGQMVIPLIALLLLIVSFFAKVPNGTKWAAIVFGDVVLQVILAFVSFGAPVVGLLHGLNAFIVLGAGIMAVRAATAAEAPAAEQAPYTAAV